MLENIFKMAQKVPGIIGIGVSGLVDHAKKTVDSAMRAQWNGYAKRILIVATSETFEEIGAVDTSLVSIVSEDPETDLIKLLDGEVNGIVRGSLDANKMLAALKSKFRLSFLARLALLETSGSHRFFFAPIGIDEGRTVKEKVYFISEGVKLIQSLGNVPKVAVLSGGRTSDVGRDKRVDNTIKEAENVVKEAKREIGDTDIKHYEILIENAIADKANLIIAPDGISGNLIYRTLIHLGAGGSCGAPFLGLPKPVVDTSRVGPIDEYVSAIAFASALVTKA
ncbi:MAG: methanogenesis marker protein Mmp4/MtxX [Candidatus Atabeyarchaeum deiterrae]